MESFCLFENEHPFVSFGLYIQAMHSCAFDLIRFNLRHNFFTRYAHKVRPTYTRGDDRKLNVCRSRYQSP